MKIYPTLDNMFCQLNDNITEITQNVNIYTDVCVNLSQNYTIDYINEQLTYIQAILGCDVDLSTIVTKEYLASCVTQVRNIMTDYTDICNSTTIDYINLKSSYNETCTYIVQNNLDRCINETKKYIDACVVLAGSTVQNQITSLNTCTNYLYTYINNCINQEHTYTNNVYPVINSCINNLYTCTYNTYVVKGYENLSTGAFIEPTVCYNSMGEMILGSGTYVLYSGSCYNFPMVTRIIPGGTFCFTQCAINYVVAEYNGGEPRINVLTTRDTIRHSDVIPLFSVYKNEDCSLNFINWDGLSKGLSNRIIDRLVRTQRFVSEPDGLILGETSPRVITVGSGIVWVGATYYTLPSANSVSTVQEIL